MSLLNLPDWKASVFFKSCFIIVSLKINENIQGCWVKFKQFSLVSFFSDPHRYLQLNKEISEGKSKDNNTNKSVSASPASGCPSQLRLAVLFSHFEKRLMCFPKRDSGVLDSWKCLPAMCHPAFSQHMPQHMFCSILIGTNAFWFCHLGSWSGRSFINKFATLLGANLLKLNGLNNTKRLEVFFLETWRWSHSWAPTPCDLNLQL